MTFKNFSRFKTFKFNQAQKNKALLLASSLLLMLSFQNCANSVKFQGGAIAQSKSTDGTNGLTGEVAADDNSGGSDTTGSGGSNTGGLPTSSAGGGMSSDYTCEDLGTCNSTTPQNPPPSPVVSGGSPAGSAGSPTDPSMPPVVGGGSSTPGNGGTPTAGGTENPSSGSGGSLPGNGGSKPDSDENKCDFRGKKFKLLSFTYSIGGKSYEFNKDNNDFKDLFDLDITINKEQTDLVFSNGAEVLSIDGSLFHNSGKRFVKHYNDIDEKGSTCSKVETLKNRKEFPIKPFPNFSSEYAGHFKNHLFISLFELKVDIKFDCEKEILVIGKVKFKLHHDNGHHYGQYSEFHNDEHGHDFK